MTTQPAGLHKSNCSRTDGLGKAVRTWVRAGLWGLAFLLLHPGGSLLAAGAPSPQVEFLNNTGTVLRHWPVAGSVLVPPGAHIEPGSVALQLGEGQLVPAVARVLTRWPDGSARWLRIYGQTELRPGRTLARVLLNRPPSPQKGRPSVSGAVAVREFSNRLELDNGVLRFVVQRGGRFWIEGVAFGQRQVREVKLYGAARLGEREVRAGPIQEIAVLDRGPVRALVELRGRYEKSALVYRVRLECFANQPVVRVFHTFEVHPDEVTYERMTDLEARLTLPQLHEVRVSAALEGTATSLSARLPFSVTQRDNTTYKIGEGRASGRLSGWFDVQSPQFGVTLWARWFWQQYPQSVTVNRDQLVYSLYKADDRPAIAGTGAAKTHEFVLAFRKSGAPLSATELAALPAEGRMTAEWFERSRGLPQSFMVSSASGQKFLRNLSEAWERVLRSYDREEWDDRQEVRCPTKEEGPDPRERRRRGFYGMWNWGDWNYPGYHDTTKGCDAWGNLEYDLTQVLALSYLLTGKAGFYESMVAAGRHFMDVDIIHAQPAYPQWVGMNHPKNPLHWTFELGGVDLGHTWTEGLLSLYAITGDDRALSAAKGIGEFLLRRLKAPIKGNPRQFGWPQVALVALYETTLDAHYLEGAKEYARLGMERHAPDKIHDWKLGILAEGLSYTHRVTNDRAIAQWLKTYTQAVLAAPPPTDARLWPAVAYVAALEGNRTAAHRALETAERLNFGGWAKPFTIASRVGFAIFGNLGRFADEAATSATGEQATPVARTPERGTE